MKSRKAFACLDCGQDTGRIYEYYFVITELWLEAVGSANGMLCIGCLELRLGRELNRDDFTGAYINSFEFGPKSERLADRLTRVKEDA